MGVMKCARCGRWIDNGSREGNLCTQCKEIVAGFSVSAMERRKRERRMRRRKVEVQECVVKGCTNLAEPEVGVSGLGGFCGEHEKALFSTGLGVQSVRSGA